MKLISTITVSAIVVLAGLAGGANASKVDVIEACGANLLKNHIDYDHETRLEFSILHTVTKENWQQMRDGIDIGVDVVLKGIPLKGFGSYEEFDYARSKYFQEFQHDYRREESTRYLSTYVDPDAFKSYRFCLTKGLENDFGFFLIPGEMNSSYASYDIQWRPTTPRTEIDVDIKIVSGGTPAIPLPTKVLPYGFGSIDINRKPEQDLIVRIKPKDLQAIRIVLPGTGPTPPKPKKAPLRISGYTRTDGTFAGPNSKWLPDPQGKSPASTNSRIDTIKLDIAVPTPGLRVIYRCYTHNNGNPPWVANGEECGVKGKHLVALKFALPGKMPTSTRSTIVAGMRYVKPCRSTVNQI